MRPRVFWLAAVASILLVCAGVLAQGRDGQVARFPVQGAVDVNPDTRLVLSFPVEPVPGATGEIRVFDAETGELVDRLDMSIPAGPSTGSTSDGDAVVYQQAAIGGFTEGFHFHPVIVRGRTATITLHPAALDYGRRYYVEVDPGAIQAAGFQGLAGPDAWTFTTRRVRPDIDNARLVVAADGTGDFNTVQGAVDAIPAGPHPPVTVFIRRGYYEEIVYFRNRQDITFLGEDREGVVIAYANNEIFNGPPPGVPTNERRGTFPYRRAVFMADASTGIHVVNLTLRNLTPQGGGQAEALLMMGGRNIVSQVNAFSYQDTIQLNDATYVSDSVIVGETDFLWGRGPAFFERTILRQVGDGPFMWVRSTDETHGFVFVDCRFETPGARGAGAMLARNTERFPDSEIVLIDSVLDRIDPVAWLLPADPGRVRYWESGSVALGSGRPVDTTRRHPASRQLDPERDAAVIASYRDPAVVLGGWRPSMKPIVLSSPSTDAVDAGADVVLRVMMAAVPTPRYEWRRNGVPVAARDVDSDARGSRLTLHDVDERDEGRYTVVITNDAGLEEALAGDLVVH